MRRHPKSNPQSESHPSTTPCKIDSLRSQVSRRPSTSHSSQSEIIVLPFAAINLIYNMHLGSDSSIISNYLSCASTSNFILTIAFQLLKVILFILFCCRSIASSVRHIYSYCNCSSALGQLLCRFSKFNIGLGGVLAVFRVPLFSVC